MPDRFSFLPYAQAQLTKEFRAPADSSQPRLEIALEAEITADGAAQPGRIPLSKAVKGPGEIISIQRSAIRRVEPEPDLRAFEPNYLPFVEFHDADFPWRYSLDTSLSKARKDPWIVLIVLKAEEFTVREQGSAPLPSVIVRDVSTALPDLRESWAHAHVQLNGDTDETINVNTTLEADGGDAFSRLFSTRKLEPFSSYFMFLVPAYLAGVESGLGQRITAGFGDLSWDTLTGGSATLPIYRQWQFNTDAAEDVEFLVKRLTAFEANSDDEAGAPAKAGAERPGYYEDYHAPGAEFTIENALTQPSAAPSVVETDPALMTRMEETLHQVITGEQPDNDVDNDPLVAFPAYGHKFQGHESATSAAAQQGNWFDRVNLDLKYRYVAGLGAQVVRDNQEIFSHLAWDQYEEITAANELLARLQTAERLVKNLRNRRSDRLESSVALTLNESLQDVPGLLDGGSISEQLRKTGVPLSYVSRSLRRQSAKRGRSIGKEFPMPDIPGDRGNGSRSVADMKTESVNDFVRSSGVGSQVRQAFSTIFATDVFENAIRLEQSQVAIQRFDSTDHALVLSGVLTKLPASKADFHVAGRIDAERRALGPIWRGPSIPLPMVTYLRQTAAEAILAGVDKMPDNTLAFFVENRRFVEAFLVGANHEMNAELRWREFPTDMRSTIFRRFWNRNRPASDPKGDDISQIHNWNGKLGQNFGIADADAKADVVVVIKGDIVRKLGDPVVAISIANGDNWSVETATEHLPVFSGKLGREMAYFGFDISQEALTTAPLKDKAHFVIYEKPGRLRFGLDVANAAIRQQRFDRVSWRHDLQLHGFDRFDRGVPQVNLPVLPEIPQSPASSDDLSWSHVGLESSGHIDFGRSIQFLDGSTLWGANRNAATLARSMWQKPLAAVLPLKRVFTS